MQIINTGLFYFGNDGTAYHGKIKLTSKEFIKATRHIMNNRHVAENYINGSGKYAYMSKKLLREDLAKGKNGMYALRVAPTNYIVSMFKNTSRYHYKQQNYIIEVIS